MLGNLTPEEVDDFLLDQCFAHLGCHADGKTYVVPISYVYSKGQIIGQTKEGLKLEMLRKNPNCCLQVEKVDGIADWTSVIVWGEFQELAGIEASDSMGLLIDRLGPLIESLYGARSPRDITPSGIDGKSPNKIVYRIKIAEKSGRFESSRR
jgi:uncharacterized protein